MAADGMTAKVQIEVAAQQAIQDFAAFKNASKETMDAVEAHFRLAEEQAKQYGATARAAASAAQESAAVQKAALDKVKAAEQEADAAQKARAEHAATLRQQMGEVGMGLMAAGAGALFAAKGMLDLAGNMQQAKIGFTTLLGSASAADKMVRDLATFAAQTPFEFTGLQQTAKLMLAFGFEAKAIIPSLRTLGDAMSALGGGGEAMDRVVRQIGQIKTKGRAMGEELVVIAEAGIPVYQILAEELNLTGAEVAKIGEKGIKADVAIQALMRGLDKRFGGGMAAQAGTWQQVLSNLIDTAKMAGAEIGKGLLGPASAIAGKLTDLLAIVRSLPTGFKEFAGAATGYIGAGAMAVGGLLLVASKAEAAWAAVAATAKVGWAAMINPATVAVVAVLAVVTAVVLIVGAYRRAEEESRNFHDAVTEGGEKYQAVVVAMRKRADELSASIKSTAEAMRDAEKGAPEEQKNKGFMGRYVQDIDSAKEAIRKEREARDKAKEGLTGLTPDTAAYQAQNIAYLSEQADLLAAQIKLMELLDDPVKTALNEKLRAYKDTNIELDAARDKLKDLTKEEKAAAEQATAVAASADELVKFNDAWEKSADAVKKASDAVSEANDNIAEVTAKAAENVAKALDTWIKASDNLRDVEEKNADRMKAAIDRVTDAREKANQALLTGEERAKAKLASAEEKVAGLAEKEWLKTATPEEKEWLQAQKDQQEREKAAADLVKAQAEVGRFGQVIGEKGIVRTPAEFEADKIAREGDKAVKDAEDARDKVQVENAKALADAKERVRDAEKAYNKAVEDGAKAIQEAYAKREEALRKYAETVIDTNAQMTDSYNKLAAAQRKAGVPEAQVTTEAQAQYGGQQAMATRAGAVAGVAAPVTVNVWGNVYGDAELKQKIRDEAAAALNDAAYAK